MTKVAYNACFGGFSLSREAVVLARELSGDPKWGEAVLAGEMFEDGSGPCEDDGFGVYVDIPRTDPTLVKVIEQLGKKASGRVACLCLAEVPSGIKYRIEEYDGLERVMTINAYKWHTA